MARLLLTAVALLLAGCRSAPPTVPKMLQGPVPTAVGVHPVPLTGPAVALSGADAALRARGYRALSAAVTAELLGDRLPVPGDAATLRTAGQSAAVDAFLFVEAVRFEVDGAPVRRASWHLRWQLWSVSGALLWQHEHVGAWSQREHDAADPLRRLDEEAPFVPFGGREPRAFRSAAELAAQLHLEGLAAMPVR